MDYKEWPHQDAQFEKSLDKIVEMVKASDDGLIPYDRVYFSLLISLCNLCLDKATTNDNGLPVSKAVKDALLKTISSNLAVLSGMADSAKVVAVFDTAMIEKVSNLFCEAIDKKNKDYPEED